MSTVYEPNEAQERWLECHLDQGMFSDEMAVTYPPQGKWQKSVFVERKAVKGTAGSKGKVLVRVLNRNGSTIAILPSPNQDVVYVQAGDISEE